MSSFPIVIKQLNDANQEIRIQTIGIIVNLLKHGEWLFPNELP